MRTTTLPKVKKEGSKQVPQPNWSDFTSRDSCSKKFGRGKRKIGSTSITGVGLPSLKRVSPTINKISIALALGQCWSTRYDKYDFLNDQKKHLELINVLFPIIQKHPQFKDKGNWNEETGIREILTWLIDQYSKLVGRDNYWLVGNSDDSNDQFVVTFKEHDVDTSCYYSIPLSFMPLMKEQNLILHDLLLDLFRLIINHSGIQTWYQGMGEWALEWLQDQYLNMDDSDFEEGEKEQYERTINCYTNGKAVEYENLLNQSPCTIEDFKNRLDKFIPEAPIEEPFVELCKYGLKIIESEESIYSLVFDPLDHDSDDCERGLLPDNYVFFSWDLNDDYFANHQSYLQSVVNEYGTQPMTSWAITKPDDKQFNLPEKTDYPRYLTEFFCEGIGLIETFRDIKSIENGS